jgi:predicted nucleotidyltransferase
MTSLYELTCKSFNKAGVEYLVIGGFAVNFHGYNRSTGDLDFYVNPDKSNITRLKLALDRLGYKTGTELDEAINNGQLIHFSDRMHVIELLFSINLKVPFNELYSRGEASKIGKHSVKFINYEDLIAEKIKSQRPKDLNDVVELKKSRGLFN